MNLAADINRLGGTQAQVTAAQKAADNVNEDKPFFVTAGEETTEVFSTRPDDAFSHKLAQVSRRENHDLIRGLDGLSDANKTELALNAYYQMQGRVQQAIKREETDIGILSALETQKSDILAMRDKIQTSGSITNDAGEAVTESDVEKKLEDVQSMIDKIVSPDSDSDGNSAVRQKINESAKQDFAAYAEIFGETTGLDGDALSASDDLLIHKTDRTESDFISKAQDSIKALKAQSSGLRELKKDFMNENNISGETGGDRMSEEAMTKMAVFEFFRERFTYAGLYDNSEKFSMFSARG